MKVTGWAVKPGRERLLQWTDRSIPVYTEVSDGSDQAKGEPKCPDACGFFFHPDHVFTACPGGADNHFDYTLWLDDTLPSGSAAEGSDWGVRMPVASFIRRSPEPLAPPTFRARDGTSSRCAPVFASTMRSALASSGLGA